jgi:hypothetical protein
VGELALLGIVQQKVTWFMCVWIDMSKNDILIITLSIFPP